MPLGWEEAVRLPVPDPTSLAALVPATPEQHTWRKGLMIVVGCVVAGLVSLMVWRFSPSARQAQSRTALLDAEADSVSELMSIAREIQTSDTGQVPRAPEQPPSPSQGWVRFTRPLPTGTRIKVDGQEATIAAGDLLALPLGTHMLVVRAPGFRPDSQAMNVMRSDTSALLLQLEPLSTNPAPAPARPPAKAAMGKIVLIGSIPWGAEIRLDGRRLPLNDRVVATTPGLHWLRLSAPGYLGDSASAEVRAGARTIWVAPNLRHSQPSPPPTLAPERSQESSRTQPRLETAPPRVQAVLLAGTSFSATTDAEIRSRKNKVGDEITATIGTDVLDTSGRVVIPMGAQMTLRISAIKVSENKSDTSGTVRLKVKTLSINGRSQPVKASIARLQTHLEGRKINAGEVAKVGAGAAIGAVLGRVLGRSKKAAVIGGVMGGAVGAQRAAETRDRDVVAPRGTVVTLTLGEELVASAR